MAGRLLCAALFAFFLFSLFPSAQAQTPPAVRVGSPDTATADPLPARPHTAPVTVPLFRGLKFTDFTTKKFGYQPPPGGPRRWAKVLFVADFAVSPGRQFDRTAQVTLGGATLYFGTTMEPSRTVGPRWHVERDVTEDSALLRLPQAGEAILGNIVNETYTGVISGSASLLFFPPDRATPAAETPEVVLPLPNKPGGAAHLVNGQALSETFVFPANVVRASLDIWAESQGKDEFWYLGVPDALADKLQTFGGTAFREVQVTVDGRPAGVAPVYPWIYTGGLDPSLWRPIPGVQTLNFAPYRVDLTPFAGALDAGRTHTVGIRVVGGGDWFAVAGTLRLFRDPALAVVRGAVTADTLSAAPSPTVRSGIVTVDSETRGPVSVTSTRRFTLAGYVLTSQGRVDTRIVQSVRFASAQQFDLSPLRQVQNTQQAAALASVTTTRSRAGTVVRRQEFSYPLTVLSARLVRPDKSSSRTTTIRQGYQTTETVTRSGGLIYSHTLSNTVTPSDTVRFDASGVYTGQRDSQSTQVYAETDSRGRLYRRTIKAKNGVVRAAEAPHPARPLILR